MNLQKKKKYEKIIYYYYRLVVIGWINLLPSPESDKLTTLIQTYLFFFQIKIFFFHCGDDTR